MREAPGLVARQVSRVRICVVGQCGVVKQARRQDKFVRRGMRKNDDEEVKDQFMVECKFAAFR